MENLWKKESSEKDALFVDIFKNIRTIRTNLPSNINGLQKSNAMSTHFRNKGNQQFKDQLWYEAMESYNESLRFAEIGTENVSLAYANRAACFLHLKMFDKCLKDIELAKLAEYPENLMAKLERRKADCMEMMQRESQEQMLERKLSYEADKNFPCMANILEIRQNEEFGRYIVSQCDLSVGETILIEPAFLSSTLRAMKGILSNCANCQKTKANFIACENCTIAQFCDTDCMEQSSWHKYECNVVYDRDKGINGQLQVIAESIYFALDALGSVDKLIEFVDITEKDQIKRIPNSFIDAQSKYRLFFKLPAITDRSSFESSVSFAKTVYSVLTKLLIIEKCFDNNRKKRFLMHLTVKHTLIVSKNMATNKNQITLSLLFSLFNHACSPNLLNFSLFDQQICIVLRPIKKGQQLFVTYKCRSSDMSTANRRAQLMDCYLFLCKCDKCEPQFSASEIAKLKTDQTYKFLQRNRNQNLLVDKTRRNIKMKCIEFLNKFGHTWCPEIDFVLDMYTKSELYEHE